METLSLNSKFLPTAEVLSLNSKFLSTAEVVAIDVNEDIIGSTSAPE